MFFLHCTKNLIYKKNFIEKMLRFISGTPVFHVFFIKVLVFLTVFLKYKNTEKEKWGK